jgi:CHASE3 domain sensor protein
VAYLLNQQYHGRVRIVVRQSVSAGFVFLWALCLGAFALSAQRALHDTLRRYDADLMPSLRAIHAVVEGIDAMRRHETEYLMSTAPAEMTDLESKAMQARSQVQGSLQGYRNLVSDPEDRADYQRMLTQTQEYFQIQDRILALSRESANPGQHDAAIKLLLGGSRQAFSALTETAGAWATHNAILTSATVSDGDALYRRGAWTVIAIACWILLASVLAAVYSTRVMTGPLRQAVELAKSVASGDLTRRVDVRGER